MAPTENSREWFSLDDDEGTWLFDVTFLASAWQCIWGDGCPGIEPEPDVAGALGCCTHGAHFADDDDRRRVSEAVERLGPTRASQVVGVFDSPLLQAAPQGWVLRD